MALADDDRLSTMAEIQEIHNSTVVIDTLAGGPVVFTTQMRERLSDLNDALPTAEFFRELERLTTSAFLAGEFAVYWQAIKESMVDVLSVSVGAWGDAPFSFRGAVYDLGEWQRRFAAVPQLILITGPADLYRAKRNGITGVLLGFQNSVQLDGDVRNAETFHGLGIRMIQLTYNARSDAGDGCMQAIDEGLTTFGRELIRCMNDLGLIVDLSHCGRRWRQSSGPERRSPSAMPLAPRFTHIPATRPTRSSGRLRPQAATSACVPCQRS